MILYDEFGHPVRALAAQGGDAFSLDNRTAATLASANAEVVIEVAKERTAIVDFRGTFAATFVAEFSVDGNNYAPQLLPLWSVNLETWQSNNSVAGIFQFDIPAGCKKIRIRCTAYTSGSCTVLFRASQGVQFIYQRKIPNTLIATITAAVGVAATLSLPNPFTSLYHYINKLTIQRHTAATLVAGATPILVTTTNLAGSLVFSFGADAAAAGIMVQDGFETNNPVKSLLSGTATTIVAPAITNVIWRLTAYYYIGA